VVLSRRNFEKEQLEHLIEKYKMPYYAISAKTGQGIDELFYKIAEMLEQQ
jgi:selenocysteine-specific translation elongation factor